MNVSCHRCERDNFVCRPYPALATALGINQTTGDRRCNRESTEHRWYDQWRTSHAVPQRNPLDRCYLLFCRSTPGWVFAELEDGYEDYTEYRGDGGHDPKTEPSAHGYIHFENGVRAFYVGGSKKTSAGFSLKLWGQKDGSESATAERS